MDATSPALALGSPLPAGSFVETCGLTRRFGDFVAIGAGQAFGRIGSNGAGKTTLIRM